MLGGASLVYACFGALMASMAVLVQPISESLQLTAGEMGIILGAWQFVYIFVAIPTGVVLDRFGLRPCLAFAALMLVASAGLRVVADSFAGLLFAVLIVGVGGPLISVGAPKLVSRWFAGSERGLAMGIYISSTGIGALLATVLTNSVVMPRVGYDWQAAFGVYTVIMLSSVVIWLAIASHPSSRLGNRDPAAATGLNLGIFPRLMRHKEVQLILVVAIAVFFFAHAMMSWLPEILRAKGMTLVEAGNWTGIMAAIAIVAALVVPRFATPERRLLLLGVIALGAAFSQFALEVEPTGLLITAMIGIGVARSCLMPITMLLLMESRALDSESMGAASGLFFAVAEIGGVLGPVACGLAIGWTGRYESALWAGALSMLVIVALLPGSLAPAAALDDARTTTQSGARSPGWPGAPHVAQKIDWLAITRRRYRPRRM